jgi:Family of unknown function (DUF6069)
MFANLAVLGVARLEGANMVIQTSVSRPAVHISIVLVIVTTLFPVLIGTLALIPARRWGSRGWRALAAAGLALGVLSVVLPLAMEAGPGTRLALASMHVIAGLTWFLIVRRAATRLWEV